VLKILLQLSYLFLLLDSGLAFAQADSPSSRLDLMLSEADEQRSSSRQQFSTLLSQLTLAKGEMSPGQRSYLDFLTAYQLAYSGQHQEAEILLKDLLLPKHAPLLRFRAAYTLANVQIVRRQFVDAFSNLSQAILLSADVDDMKWRNQGLLSGAAIYSEAGLYQESIEFIALMDTSVMSQRDLCIAGQVNIQNKVALHSPVDLTTIENAAELCRQAGEKMIMHMITLQRGWYYLNQQQPEKALQSLQQQQADAEATAYNRLLIGLYQLMAQAQAELGEAELALQLIKELELAAKDLPYSTPLVAGLQLKAELAAQLGDFQHAYQAAKQFSEAERAMRDDRSAQLLAYQLAKGELLKKNQQLQLIKEEFRVVELENQLKNQQAQRDSLYIGLLSLASIVLVYVTYRLIRRHRYYKLAAENDGLTGISNRHFFDLQLQKQVKRCKQLQKSMGVIVFDLDFFKLINDNHGHDIGDKALQATVQICNHFIRSGDIFGRIGGEEFAIVLPDCQPDKVLMLAEICRDAIEQLDCSHIQSGLKLTASFGVSYSQISGYQPSELMRHADQALYLAKYNGRNRVESYDQMQTNPGRPLIHSPLR
jgi:diguanylate cyclase (GGDEF)-like protein